MAYNKSITKPSRAVKLRRIRGIIMSYNILRNIKIDEKKNSITITVASNNLTPHRFYTTEYGAVKEFAEKLKERCHNYYPSIDYYCCSQKAVNVKDIDELLKEYEK